MGIFGWSYPPGCSGPPEDYASYGCDVCLKHCDDCICPECPVCLTFGAPSCYALSPEGHGMKFTVAQLDARADHERMAFQERERARAEAEYEADPQRKVEEAELQRYWNELQQHEASK